MSIAERLNSDSVVMCDCDSRSVWICRQEDVEKDGIDLAPVATTGCGENESYGLSDLSQEMVAGHWVLVAYGDDDTTAWWDEDEEVWVDGEPS